MLQYFSVNKCVFIRRSEVVPAKIRISKAVW